MIRLGVLHPETLVPSFSFSAASDRSRLHFSEECHTIFSLMRPRRKQVCRLKKILKMKTTWAVSATWKKGGKRAGGAGKPNSTCKMWVMEVVEGFRHVRVNDCKSHTPNRCVCYEIIKRKWRWGGAELGEGLLSRVEQVGLYKIIQSAISDHRFHDPGDKRRKINRTINAQIIHSPGSWVVLLQVAFS